MFYLAYGSNLNKAQMGMRCPSASPVATAEIEGYRLMYKGSKTGAYLTIEPQEGHTVPVGVWEITESDLAALDIYEGFPMFYYRKQINVVCSDGKARKAWVYIMHEDRRLGTPSPWYVQTCAEGYDDFGFDKKVLYDAVTEEVG